MSFQHSRRRVLKAAITGAVASAGLPMINVGVYQVFASSSRRYSARALKLIERSLVIDMLAPLKLDFSPERQPLGVATYCPRTSCSISTPT